MDNLHHMVGFWISLPLLFLSLTGIYIAFPAQSHALFGLPAPPSPQQRMGEMDGGMRDGAHHPGGPGAHDGHGPKRPSIDADQAVTAALAARPGHALQVLTLPTGKVRAYRVEFTDASPAVLVDAATAVVTAAPPERTRATGDPFSRWVRQTHEGEALGPIWKWIAFATGFAPTLLAVTGIALWLMRRGRRARLAEAA
jgi:uncharacterized iron-regulated membrane protein